MHTFDAADRTADARDKIERTIIKKNGKLSPFPSASISSMLMLIIEQVNTADSEPPLITVMIRTLPEDDPKGVR
jgi:hypothetical protein